MTRVSIVGGSGYVGGELLRWLLPHSGVEVAQVISRSQAGRPLAQVHPTLRGQTALRFVAPADLTACDVLFLCLPHGEAQRQMDRYAGLAERIIDLSADFRLSDAAAYERWYGVEHAAPTWLPRFVYGLPELTREELRGAHYASGVGCNASVLLLALGPLARAGGLRRIVADVRVGSSEAGAAARATSHHPVRSGALRVYSTERHRHLAEWEQVYGEALPVAEVTLSLTAVEMVRGVQLLARVDLREPLAGRDLWRIYRSAYGEEPFIRIVSGTRGAHRLPEPRVVAGTNFCDVGFVAPQTANAPQQACGRITVVAALDNLGKGAAGSAVQCMNLMLGLDEREGLRFAGFYP
ncbi:MAG: N-acetyl-gamma-glutamyl-phosphate reductase [Chloroflexi bacterium]|nr:N-acetyl-gamma-glutamyl-phosphate reductase [Chloroflexota bacterium]